MAEATNEKGEVTTSSPGSIPEPRTARCNAAVPLEMARDVRRAHPLGEALLELGDAGADTDLARAQGLEHELLLALAHHGAGEGNRLVRTH